MKENSQISILLKKIESDLASKICKGSNQSLNELWGVGLFYLINFQITKKLSYLNQCVSIFTKSISILILNKNSSTALHDGLCGFYYLYLMLVKTQCIERDEKLELYFGQRIEHSSSTHKLDLIDGVMGNYIVTKDVKFLEYSSYLLVQFQKELNSVLGEEKTFINQSLNQRERYLLNTSLAHGWASKLYFVSKYKDNLTDNETKLRMLEVGFSIYKKIINSEQDCNGLSFPCYSNCSDKFSKRLAWCHNDLGIGYSILIFGMQTSNQLVVEKAISILKSTLDLNFGNNIGVLDPFICHGSSGIALVYHQVYLLTGDMDFKVKANYWLKICYSQILHSNIIYDDIGFLQGLSGLGIAVLYLEGIAMESDWLELIHLRV